VRGFLSTKIDFMLKIGVKRHVLSVLYLICQHDSPKSRESMAVFLKVGKSRALDQNVGTSRKSRARWLACELELHITVSLAILC